MHAHPWEGRPKTVSEEPLEAWSPTGQPRSQPRRPYDGARRERACRGIQRRCPRGRDHAARAGPAGPGHAGRDAPVIASPVAGVCRLSGLIRLRRSHLGQPSPAVRPHRRGRHRASVAQPSVAADHTRSPVADRGARQRVPGRQPGRQDRRARLLRSRLGRDGCDLAGALHYLATNERLLASNTTAAFFARERRRALIGVATYLVAGLVALWEPVAGKWARGRMTPCGGRVSSAPGKPTVAPSKGAL